jgi:hypothetical protein
MNIKNVLVLGLKLKREFTGKNNAVRVTVHGAKPKKINQFFMLKKWFASLRWSFRLA